VSREFNRGRSAPKNINPAKIFYIFGEGAVTEKLYFEALEKHLNEQNPLNPVKINYQLGGHSKTIHVKVKAKQAELKKDKQKNDQVWGVFDHDNDDEFNTDVESFRQSKLNCAVSIPNFENWLILHFVDFHKPTTKDSMANELNSVNGDTYKDKSDNFSFYVTKYKSAERRAKNQCNQRKIEGSINPMTTVYKLTQALCKTDLV
jgi:hypothetical protein